MAFAGVSALPAPRLDLVTIVGPTSLNAEMVARLGPTPVLCEKAAVGVETQVGTVAPAGGLVWVHYAFGFLDVVR